MVRLRIPPLRGLMTSWFASGYNFFIPSGLKQMSRTVNQKDIPVTYQFRLNTFSNINMTSVYGAAT